MADLFRVRRGLFGKSVLQKLVDIPSLIGGHVDSSVRDVRWADVSYSKAPTALVLCERLTPNLERKLELILDYVREQTNNQQPKSEGE